MPKKAFNKKNKTFGALHFMVVRQTIQQRVIGNVREEVLEKIKTYQLGTEKKPMKRCW